MNNCFLKNPPRIIVYDALHLKIKKIYCVLGDVPKAIYDAVLHGRENILAEYYGSKYKQKLLMTEASIKNAEPLICRARESVATNVIGGDEFEEEAEVDPVYSDLFGNIESLLDAGAGTGMGKDDVAGQKFVAQSKSKVKNGVEVEYIMDVYVYPEDKFVELRDKISLITGIEYYRQHVFYEDPNGTHKNLYRVYTDEDYGVNILQASSDSIAGIPIDKVLYAYKDIIKVEATEYFEILDNYHTFYVVDLDDYLGHTQLKTFVKDAYVLSVLYYGFIIKYFPALTYDGFVELLTNKSEFLSKYPMLARDVKQLAHKYKYESAIINENYKTYNALSISLPISISEAYVIHYSNATINIRNLFDALRTDHNILEVRAYIRNGRSKYYLNKKSTSIGDIPFPSIHIMGEGLIMAINIEGAHDSGSGSSVGVASARMDVVDNERSRYIYLNVRTDGSCVVRTRWNDEDEISFVKLKLIVQKYINPILEMINKLGDNVVLEGRLKDIVKLNYQSLSVSIFWKKILSSIEFKVLKGALNSYYEAGIVAQHLIKTVNTYEILFRKGIYDYDEKKILKIFSSSGNINFNNYYSHLSNQTIKQKWDQNYNGKVMRIIHQITAIKFEVLNISEREFNLVINYVRVFVHKLIKSNKLVGALIKYDGSKKLKKLKESDPELFNIKKHNGKKVYSVICQSQHQPILYGKEEMKSLSVSEKRELTEYWNFTHNEPAYYACPNADFPHLSFIVGDVHPKGYCIPCCHKAPTNEESKKADVRDTCMKPPYTHMVMEKTHIDHVFVYTKEIPVGRITKLPQMVIKLMDEIGASNTHIFGISQNYGAIANVAVLHLLAMVLKKTIPVLMAGLIKMFLANNWFDTILNGKLSKYFDNCEALVGTMRDYFVLGKSISTHYTRIFLDWNDLFIDLLMVNYNFNIVIFEDVATKIVLYPSNKTYVAEVSNKNDYLILFKNGAHINPVISGEDTVVMSAQSKIISYIKTMMHNTKPVLNVAGIDYSVIRESSALNSGVYKMVKKYINRSGLCYGVLVAVAGKEAYEKAFYIPVEYFINVVDGVAESYTMDEDVCGTVAQVVAFVVEYHLVAKSNVILFDRAHTFAGRVRALSSRGLMFYCDDEIGALVGGVSHGLMAGGKALKMVELMADPLVVVNAILEKRAPVKDKSVVYVGRAIYENYLYQLISFEFMNYCARDRNKSLRDKIMREFELSYGAGGRGDAKGVLRFPNLKQFGLELADRYILAEMMKNVGGFVCEFLATRFKFDNITMNEIKAMNEVDACARILEILRMITVDVPLREDLKFDNIFSSCASKRNVSEFCHDHKLIVNGVDQYVSILAGDIKKNILSKMDTDAGNYINFLDFKYHPNEQIDIYKL